MKTLTLSQRVPIAEIDEGRRLPLVPRPTTRHDCVACESCQKWRDEGANRRAKPLECGHTFDQAYSHSRPCVWVSCRSHLYLDVTSRGSCKLNFPDRDVEQLRETCCLDVAERGEHTLEEIGELMNVTRERARQLEARGLAKSRHSAHLDLVEEAPDPGALARLRVLLDTDPDFFGGVELDDEEDEDGPVAPSPGELAADDGAEQDDDDE